MAQTAIDIGTLVKEVNRLLEAGEPANISTDEHSGYTGYKPQHIIDAMNDVFGVGVWGFEEVSSEIVPTGDKGASLAVAQVKVWLKDVPSAPVGWGQNRVTRGDIGDARKGAQTDAIKKALSYFSIGNRAYQGLLVAGGNGNGHAAAQPTVKNTLDNSPASKQQLSEITRLASALGRQVTAPETYRDAQTLLTTLAREYNKAPSGNGTAAITRGELFERGEERGMWTRMAPSAFYAMASAITGKPQSKGDWTMTADEMAEMARQIETERATPASGK